MEQNKLEKVKLNIFVKHFMEMNLKAKGKCTLVL